MIKSKSLLVGKNKNICHEKISHTFTPFLVLERRERHKEKKEKVNSKRETGFLKIKEVRKK